MQYIVYYMMHFKDRVSVFPKCHNNNKKNILGETEKKIFLLIGIYYIQDNYSRKKCAVNAFNLKLDRNKKGKFC